MVETRKMRWERESTEGMELRVIDYRGNDYPEVRRNIWEIKKEGSRKGKHNCWV